MDLDGRVCVITGGASGIGAAGARRFAEAGARVVVADVDAEHARSVASEVGGTAFAVDVMVADVVARHGRLDVLWANAGIAGVRAPCAEQPTDAWERVLRVNLTGVFQCFRAALRPMLEAGRGALLATASVAGLRASAGSPA